MICCKNIVKYCEHNISLKKNEKKGKRKNNKNFF